MKLNPLPWIEKWLSQPSDFWKAMNDFNEKTEDHLQNQLKEKKDDLDFQAAVKLADDLFGIKS
ncbi:hypothetical protein AU156_gp025 [Edwardsiella phage PEi20]|uniref:Uncharacterized protein n=2 Tax=Kanagawavirus pei20 TaxID=2844109 RepID=A0A0B6VTT0_9CAUD|nr:hypothetical protein AU156_gp025 [Edwardsiella phage PEi20]BAQ22675.1 hypothetical protein [Edwardsiella phage PEi20]BAQ22976.1 hypothetical protein [Edwardsiella phage PEi26]